ncbi:hypothetical protein WJX84_010583 [Apatococcus fuscideae]
MMQSPQPHVLEGSVSEDLLTNLCTPQDDRVGLQVSVVDKDGVISSSEIRPVRLPGYIHQQHAAEHVPSHIPSLNLAHSQDWRERLFLTFNWASFMQLLFWSIWSFHVTVMLMLPRLAGPCIQQRLEQDVTAAHSILWLPCWLASALCRWAQHPLAWRLQVGHAAYLAVGPWMAARLLTSQPLGFFLPGSILIRQPDLQGHTSWQWQTERAFYVPASFHLAFTIIPLTLWAASFHQARLRWGQHQSSWNQSWRVWHVAACGVLMCMPLGHINVLWRACWMLYGPASVLLSPGLGWTVIWVVTILWLTRSKGTMQPASKAGKSC